MLELAIFIILGLVILVLFELRARKQSHSDAVSQRSGLTSNSPKDDLTSSAPAEECCGQHLVCERETLLQTNAQIEYFDDEELDALAGINPEDFTKEQHEEIRAVFDTLQEKDVPAWCRSVQLRNIALPQDIREEALLICRERRQKK